MAENSTMNAKEKWKSLLSDFISEQFVADGMCADVSIHDTDGHNPHAHILLTVRPLTKEGKWQYKTEKEYVCVRNGEERGFTASEFRTAQYSISTKWERRKSICPLLRLKRMDMNVSPNIPKAQDTEGRIRYQNAGTVRNSF